MDKFFAEAKEKKVAIYIAVFLTAVIVTFAAVLFFQNYYKNPNAPSNSFEQQPIKEKTMEEVIKDLSIPVPIPKGAEKITEKTIKSLSDPVSINKENSISGDEIKDAVKGLSKPVEINKK